MQFKTYPHSGFIYKGGFRKKNVNGSDMLKLSSNENRWGCSPMVKAAILNSMEEVNIYPDNNDIRMRKALVELYNCGLSEENFLCASSGSEIIDLVFRSFLNPSDEIILSTPGFPVHGIFPTWNMANVVNVPLNSLDFSLDVERILENINERTKVVVVCSPNNPLGTYIPNTQLKYLTDHLPDHVLLMYDEVYHHYVDASDYSRAIPFVLSGKNVIAINSFSKAYGLAGLRIGYAYSTPQVCNHIRKICKSFLLPTISINAAVAAIDDQKHLNSTIANTKIERQFLYNEFDNLGIEYIRSQTNFITIRPTVDARLIIQDLEERSILVRSTDNYGLKNGIRVTIGKRAENETFLDAWAEILFKNYNNDHRGSKHNNQSLTLI